MRTVTLEQLQALAARAPKPEPTKSTASNGLAHFESRLDVPAWLTARGVAHTVKGRPDSKGRTVFILERCPFDAAHGAGGEVAIFQGADGKLGAGCMHNGCAGRGWAEFRDAIGKPDATHWDPPLNRNGSGAGNANHDSHDAPPAKPGGQLPEIEDAFALCSENVSLPPELIEGILHQGSKLSLGGASKAFKSWALLNMGLSVAYGLPWMGHHTTRARVLIVNLEIQRAFFRQRIATVASARGILLPGWATDGNEGLPEWSPGWLDTWNLRGYATCHQEIFPKIVARIRDKGYGLLILDPVYKLYGGKTDENSAGDVAALLNSVESIAVETGAAVAFGAHYSKGNQAAKNAIDRVSGSGVFARDPDSILNLTEHERPDCFTLEATLRNLPPLSPYVVRWAFPLFVREDGADPTALRGGDRQAAREQQRKAKAASDLEADRKEIVTAAVRHGQPDNKTTIRELTGIGHARFDRAWASLLADQTIRPDGQVRKSNKQTYDAFRVAREDEPKRGEK